MKLLTKSKRTGGLFANLRTGPPDVSPSRPSHIRGVQEGNARSGLRREPGFWDESDLTVKGTARRSTGIGAKAREPIDPRMPNLSPA